MKLNTEVKSQEEGEHEIEHRGRGLDQVESFFFEAQVNIKTNTGG